MSLSYFGDTYKGCEVQDQVHVVFTESLKSPCKVQGGVEIKVLVIKVPIVRWFNVNIEDCGVYPGFVKVLCLHLFAKSDPYPGDIVNFFNFGGQSVFLFDSLV